MQILMNVKTELTRVNKSASTSMAVIHVNALKDTD